MNENAFSAGFKDGNMVALSLIVLSCPEKALQSYRCLEADSLYGRLFHPWLMSGIYLEKL